MNEMSYFLLHALAGIGHAFGDRNVKREMEMLGCGAKLSVLARCEQVDVERTSAALPHGDGACCARRHLIHSCTIMFLLLGSVDDNGSHVVVGDENLFHNRLFFKNEYYKCVLHY